MAPSSWKWVKDSMRPASEYKTAITDALKDTSPPVAAAAAEAEAPSPLAQQGTFDDQPFEPTPALVDYTSKMNTAIPKPEPHSIAEKDGPSKVDQILLFLTAMKKPDYRVPVLQVHRMEELQPSSTSAFIHSLHKIQPGDKEDEELVSLCKFCALRGLTLLTQISFSPSLQYTKSVSSWRSKHRAQSPLTVFSKSYCPYSKRAKALLKEMGAQFEVYEVDLRDDAQSLQAGLKELSTHATVSLSSVQLFYKGGMPDTPVPLFHSSLPSLPRRI